MIFLRKEVIVNDLKKFQNEINSRYSVLVEVYENQVNNHTTKLGYLLEVEGVIKLITRKYIVNEQLEYAVIQSDPWNVSRYHNETVKEEGNYKILGDAIEAALNPKYPVIISGWVTKNIDNQISTVVIFESEDRARNRIGRVDINGKEISDVVKGYSIYGSDDTFVEGSEDFYQTFDEAHRDLKMLMNRIVKPREYSSDQQMAVTYDEQIYLLHYWLRTNIVDFKPTLENVKEQLFLEFGIKDGRVYQDVFQLFEEK